MEAYAMKLPKCRHCGRAWLPRDGAVAMNNYCKRCRAERRLLAGQVFELRPITGSDVDGAYVLPRRLRGRWPKRA
jgi:hypothetical protein